MLILFTALYNVNKQKSINTFDICSVCITEKDLLSKIKKIIFVNLYYTDKYIYLFFKIRVRMHISYSRRLTLTKMDQ